MGMSEQQRATVRSIIDGYTSGEDKKIPGLVYLAFRGDGEPVFQHCSGTIGVSSEQPMSLDTTFWVASFTKLATSVACMQLVEWGVLRLDDADQVEGICPQLGDVSVLDRDENGYLRLVEKSGRITLRMLLNHTGSFSRVVRQLWAKLTQLSGIRVRLRRRETCGMGEAGRDG